MSLNFGIGGKPARSTFVDGNFADGGRGTVVLCPRSVCMDAELRSRRMKKISRAESREK
jgi:hypothetical protein